MTNIYDVAKKAGVSHMTVSRVFNNPELVNKKTRDKVINITKKLDYRPSLIARSMRTKKTNYLGIIIPSIINPIFPEIIRAIDDCAIKHNYNIILFNTDSNYEKERSALKMLASRGIDGIIISGIAGGKKDTVFVNNIKKIGIPIILIDRYIPSSDTSYVVTNNFKAAYEATNYLIKLGHRKIGVISPPVKIKIFNDRLDGYKSALKNNNIELIKYNINECDESISGGYGAVKELLSKNYKTTAILSMCDFIAFGAYQYLHELKINIPNDISIISIDDIFISSLMNPPLTTMSQQKYKMGCIATDILIESIEKKIIPTKKIVLDANLVVRSSCKNI